MYPVFLPFFPFCRARRSGGFAAVDYVKEDVLCCSDMEGVFSFEEFESVAGELDGLVVVAEMLVHVSDEDGHGLFWHRGQNRTCLA